MVVQRGDAIEQALHSMDRPDRPAGFAGVWWVPAAEWGQALPHPFAGAHSLRSTVMRLLDAWQDQPLTVVTTGISLRRYTA